jgi:predicted nucleic acid-binding protein
MLAALDSNIMVYAEGINDVARRDIAQAHLAALGPDRVVVPLQALGELVSAQIRVARRTVEFAATRALDWRDRYQVQETTKEVFDGALQIMEHHKLQVWDTIILSAAAVAGASVLLSEDMQNGFKWQNVTIVNPFSLTPKELLEFMSLAARH